SGLHFSRKLKVGGAIAALLGMLGTGLVTGANAAPNTSPVGSGFTVTRSDLAFILKQIKIAERHSRSLANTEPTQGPNPDTAHDPEYCSSLVGPNPDQIPDYLTAYGLRTVDGGCNNLVPATLLNPNGSPVASPNGPDAPVTQKKYITAQADQPFPRLTSPVFRKADPITSALPVGPLGPTTYAQKTGNVVDQQPRVISNLIVDQTGTNPAAVSAAKFPVRTQGNTGVDACTTDPTPGNPDGVPAGCTPSHHTLFIPNVTTDVGLSPPYNSLFTFFGQFFDHGVDQTVKSGSEVFIPLRADDPLRTLGPNGIAGDGDEVPASQAFMVLTRAQNQPGPDGQLGTADDVQDANNTDTPWVDQSQTYTSHTSHQFFLRQYVAVNGKPVATGKLLGGLDNDGPINAACSAAGTCLNDGNAKTGSISTWASTKKQARDLLGMKLTDYDVTNIPMIATDPYGNFIPDPVTGMPDYVTAHGLVSGDLTNPVPVPADVIHFDTPFLTDIAHNADPSPQDLDHNGSFETIPVPDTDTVPNPDFTQQAPGTYDDEMLNDHFTCGDGRCNENIALSTVHQIFHHEHDRLVDDEKATIENPNATDTLKADFQATNCANGCATNDASLPTTFTYGERLFQAARFVTEMEYQHLVFEEFGRKIQPAIRPFHVYNTDLNAAIPAEFAHAVYRFGHSMLDDSVARTNVNPSTGAKTDNSLPLLKAFLNPPELFNGGSAGTLSPEAAAGSIIMGSSDQVGNELDEFVTETLRNNLLGLPLDLATINMARAREAGIPPLNDVRRQIFARTNDGQLQPYTSWSDYGQHLKHPESLINFVAAYGTHPTIRDSGPDGVPGNADDVTTVDAKRAAARAIVDPQPGDMPPCDAAAFMFSTDGFDAGNCPDGMDWSPKASGVTTTGLDSVDLWVGGLAEVTNLFGGLLGTTFNYVFQSSMENLQDGDRLYYLNRTPGMNLRTQLEGNSFSELIMRNTVGVNSLKSDAFSTADCRFQLAALSGTAAGYSQFGATVADDPSTKDCDESKVLLRQPNGTIQYRQINSVDPSGINGQSVYNGTDGVDRIFGGNDNDTFWGGAGNDVIEGNGGDDVTLGGDGNDIETDLGGADVQKGGPGNDALDGGIGNDIFMGGDGSDFINGGANDNETFAGPGNDFIIAGLGADAAQGDGGDDWIEGGSGQDLLIGDHGAPFFDDPAQLAPGNDVFIGQVGENDYDAEGGDDLMAQNAAIDRNAGAGGFDWAFHQYDTVGANDDMEINNNLAGLPIQVVVNRDRWQETEADSGSQFDDVIRGTTRAPATVGGAGFTGCDVIDQAGIDRIAGLAAIMPQPLTGDPAPVIAASAAGYCPVNGPIWGDGDILLGGGGSDTIEGRDNNDIIDGDRSLSVRISLRTNPDDPNTEVGSTDLMEHAAVTGNFGAGTTNMTLQQAVFAGKVDPGNLVIVREIGTPFVSPSDVDTAVYSGPSTNYTIEQQANGSVLVTDNVGTDGVDTLWNMEQAQFTDGTVDLTSLTAAEPAATLSADAASFGSTTTGTPGATQTFAIGSTGTGTLVVSSVTLTGTNADQFSITANTCAAVSPGASCTLSVQFLPTSAGPKTATLTIASNAPDSPATVTLTGTGTAAASAPDAPTIGTATAGAGQATVNWTAPANNGGSAITGYSVRVVNAATNAQVGALRPAAATATSLVVTGLTNGTSYSFQVSATNAVGSGAFSALSTPVTLASVPDAPTVGTATPGNAQATVNWTAPANNGGSAITGYSVKVVNAATNAQVGALRPAAATATSLVVTGLTNGTSYSFQVSATNAVGSGAFSALSTAVTPAAVPNGPTAVTAVAANASATVSWTAPTNNGGSAITGYTVKVVNAATNVQVGAL
ncbi:MAG TPA: peroxidase family protein, partial [Ilumatobacteraceae bacterium]